MAGARACTYKHWVIGICKARLAAAAATAAASSAIPVDSETTAVFASPIQSRLDS